MIEVMIVLMVATLSSFIFLKPINLTVVEVNEFQSSFLHTQFTAMRLSRKVEMKTNSQTEFPIHFNANGNVNMGQTVTVGNRVLVIMIGTGRIYEKSILDD